MKKSRLFALALLLLALTGLCMCASAASLVYAPGPGDQQIVSVSDAKGSVSALTDGATSTAWTKSASSYGADLTLEMYNATVGEIWIRNGHCYSQNYYNYYDRPEQVTVTLWYSTGYYASKSVTYRYRMSDAFRPNANTSDWNSGYQRLLLPQQYRNVTRIELTVNTVTRGNGRTGATITDIAVGSGSHATATPRRVTATPKPYVQYITPTPTQQVDIVVPTRDVVVITPRPTDPLVEYITPEPEDDVDVFFPSEGIPAKLKQRMYTRSGPSTQYDELGGFQGKGATVSVISRVWSDYDDLWWLHVEVWDEEDGGWYRVYTPETFVDIDINRVPKETVEYERCWMLTKETAYCGPGTEFAYKKAYPVYDGAVVKVYVIEGNWAQVEYHDYGADVLRRAWVPIDSLTDRNPN